MTMNLKKINTNDIKQTAQTEYPIVLSFMNDSSVQRWQDRTYRL
jgi:hypothetical protein